MTKTQYEALKTVADAGGSTRWYGTIKAGTVKACANRGWLRRPDRATVTLTDWGRKALDEHQPPKLKDYGTCPCCFRGLRVTKGKLTRHGWQEAGGRRIGEYGNAWHVGSCFGVGYLPFEVSPEGTKAYIAKVLLPARDSYEETLKRLATRPPLTVETRYDPTARFRQEFDPDPGTLENTRWHGQRPSRKRRLSLLPLDNGPAKVPSYDGERAYTVDVTDDHHPCYTYEKELASRVGEAQGSLDAVEREIAHCEHAVANWKAGKLWAA